MKFIFVDTSLKRSIDIEAHVFFSISSSTRRTFEFDSLKRIVSYSQVNRYIVLLTSNNWWKLVYDLESDSIDYGLVVLIHLSIVCTNRYVNDRKKKRKKQDEMKMKQLKYKHTIVNDWEQYQQSMTYYRVIIIMTL
jgi:hypothetical protein